MSIMKGRDAAFNYGCLMAELKEKMVQFRSRLNKGEEEEDQARSGDGKLEGEVKIARDSLISENDLDFSLNSGSDSKIRVCSEGFSKRTVPEMISEPDVETVKIDLDDDAEDRGECRLGFSGDSRMFPYPICFVSKSLPTPPKDYNLRKTGIDLNKSKYLKDEEMVCSRVSRKLMLFGGKESGQREEKWWELMRDIKRHDSSLEKSPGLSEARKEESSLDCEKANVQVLSETQMRPDYNKYRKESLRSLRLPQTLDQFAMNNEISNQKEDYSGMIHKPQNSQSLESMKSFEENIPSKCENSALPQFLALSCLSKGENPSNHKTNSCDKYSESVMMTSNIKIDEKDHKRHPEVCTVSKKKTNPNIGRSNIITTRYYKMASQLRVIY
ncbi:hypothetical protein OIY81_1761 [Cryptosporidium canis]|nr:hypothetical protein OIY81_1761 [Cryptosporidium canis]